jgi:hypothetical protein
MCVGGQVDANNVLRNSIPLDFLWNAIPPCVTNCVSVSLSVPQTTYTATVGQPFSFTVTQTTLNPAGYTSKINNTYVHGFWLFSQRTRYGRLTRPL